MADEKKSAQSAAAALYLCVLLVNVANRCCPGYGRLLSAGLGCIVATAIIVWLIVVLVSFADQASNERNSTSLSPPPPQYMHGAKAEKHSPTESDADWFWSNWIFIILFISLITTPTCYYVPSYMRRYGAAKPVPAPSGGETTRFPLLALPSDTMGVEAGTRQS